MHKARWNEHGRLVVLLDEDGRYFARAELKDWWPIGAAEPESRWVVSFTVGVGETSGVPTLYERDVKFAGVSLHEASARVSLEAQAREVIASGPLPAPKPVVPTRHAANSPRGRMELVKLTIRGWEEASRRLDHAARRINDPAGDQVRIAVTDLLAWTRLADEIFAQTWKNIPGRKREEASLEADRCISTVFDLSSDDRLGLFDAAETRRSTGKPYEDWSHVVIPSDVVREELQGLRWLAGKLLHLGPRPAVHLVQWRAGQKPRWQWRKSEEIVPDVLLERDERQEQREHYDRDLAGVDVVGSLEFMSTLVHAERTFLRLLGASSWTD